MLRSSRSLFFFITLALPATLSLAQTAPPTPRAENKPQQPSQSPLTLHSSARIVVVDVVVTDKHQHAVHNLQASDFVVTEKNTQQQIKHFEEHTSLSPLQTAALPHLPAMPAGIFSNYTPIQNNGAINVLLIDTLNTPTTDQAIVRNQLRQYINSAPGNTRIAIFGLGGRLTLLQSFTSDPAVLKNAINHLQPKNSPLIEDAVAGTGSNSLSDSVQGAGGVPSPGLTGLLLFEAETASFKQEARALNTLRAINQIARYLAGIPGRKNLIWFSEAFPFMTAPNRDILTASSQQYANQPFMAMVNVGQDFKETVNLLAAAQVSVYPIDARGVVTSPSSDTSNSNFGYVRNMDGYAHDEAAFALEVTDAHNTMYQIAEDTGGRAFMNSNDLSGSVEKAIEAGSNYYTLTYSPTDTNWNGDFRRIQVKLQQKGLNLNLSYRRGYYADNPNLPRKRETVLATRAANSSPVIDTMHAAMLRGSPEPSEIIFKVRVVPATATPEDALAPKNTFNPAVNIPGPYRRFSVDFAADPRAIFFNLSPKGNRQGGLQFVSCLYDQDGRLINIIDDKEGTDISPANFLETLKHGIPWHQEISVPVKGTYYLRIGIHDLASNRVGAVEIPVAAVQNLPLLANSATPANSETAPATMPK
jgi:VWFA-related protein